MGKSSMKKCFWKTFQTLTGINTTKGTVEKPVLDNRDNLTTNDSEKANAFANKLSKIHNTHTGPIFDDQFKTVVENYVRDNEEKFKPLQDAINENDDAHVTLASI
jgi:hypothetical protein